MHKRRVISSVFQMEVAVVDYESDTTVEIGNTCYWYYKLGCVLVNYVSSAIKKRRFRIICESNSIADLCNNYGLVSTRNLLIDILRITNTMKGPNAKVGFRPCFCCVTEKWKLSFLLLYAARRCKTLRNTS